MKKMFRKIAAMSMAMAMLLSFGMTALATDVTYAEKYAVVNDTIGNYSESILYKGEPIRISVNMSSMTSQQIENVYDEIINIGKDAYLAQFSALVYESFDTNDDYGISLATETTSSHVYLETQNGDNNSGIESVSARQSCYAEFSQRYAEEYYFLMTLDVYVEDGIISDVQRASLDTEGLRHANVHFDISESTYIRSDGLTASYNINYTLVRTMEIGGVQTDLEKDMVNSLIIYSTPN